MGNPLRVAIVAQGDSWRSYRGVDVDEVWAINHMGLRIAHDLLFHMDDCRLQESRDNSSITPLIELLQVHPRFITSKAYPEYVGAEAFPLEEVVNCVGTTYLNGTTAYAVAYAIYSNVSELHLYGCDFSYPNRHKAESGRGCVEHLLGIAKERGIQIVLPEDTSLMDQNVTDKPYGYDAYHVTFGEENGRITVTMTDKPLPTGEEIERRYA